MALLSSCYVMPPLTKTETKRITTPYGPEDILVDSFHTPYRLLASCSARRPTEPDTSAIISVNPANDEVKALPRIHEPEWLNFNPHGFDLCKVGEKQFLFVISHDDQIRHCSYVVKYELQHDSLFFINAFIDPLIISPNAIRALPDGSFFFGNDAGKRNSKLDLIFARRRGSMIYGDGNGHFQLAAAHLAYANGIQVDEKHLYVATTRQNKVFVYDRIGAELRNRSTLATTRAFDNLRWATDGTLLAPAHIRIFRFAKHFSHPELPSPSIIYKVDTSKLNVAMKKIAIAFADDGRQISTCSTAVQLGGYYYLGQVFEPFVLKVSVK
jgi:sugar lactone lactonase YvrE